MATSLSFGDYSAEDSGSGQAVTVPYGVAPIMPPSMAGDGGGGGGGYSSTYSSSYSGAGAGQGFADLGKMSTAAAAGGAASHMSSFSQSSFADEAPLLEGACVHVLWCYARHMHAASHCCNTDLPLLSGLHAFSLLSQTLPPSICLSNIQIGT